MINFSSFYKLLLTSLFGLYHFSVYSQTGGFVWAKDAGGSDGASKTIDAVIDDQNNIFVAGTFESQTIVFDSFTLTNNGQIDIFLVKYDPSGHVSWAKNYGGTDQDLVSAITLDNSGDIVIVGNYRSSNMLFGTTSLNNSGGNDIFVTKLDSSGNTVWARSAGSPMDEFANDVGVNDNDSIFVVGNFPPNTLLSFGNTQVSSIGSQQAFIVNYNSTGTDLWAISSNGTSGSSADKVIVNHQNELVVLGAILTPGSYIFFGTDSLYANFHSAQYVPSSYIAKFQTNGLFLIGNVDTTIYMDPFTQASIVSIENTSLTIDYNNNYYLSVMASGTPIWGDTPTEFSIFKLDDHLNTVWKKEFPHPGYFPTNHGVNQCSDLTIYNGELYGVGSFTRDSIFFETDTLSNQFFSRIFTNIFAVKYDTLGTEIWVKKYGDGYSDFGKEILPFGNDDFYLIGHFESDPLQLENKSLNNNNTVQWVQIHAGPDRFWRDSKIFIAQYSDDYVGINENEHTISVSLFPNPSLGKIMLRSDEVLKHVKVTNSLGQVIFTYNDINEKFIKFDLGDQQPGIYYFLLTSESGSHNYKAILN